MGSDDTMREALEKMMCNVHELIAVDSVKRLEAKTGDYIVIEFQNETSFSNMTVIAQRWRPVFERSGLVPLFIPPGCRVTGFIPSCPEPEVEGEMDMDMDMEDEENG
jgi:hypothetical protein